MNANSALPGKKISQRYVRVVHTREHSAFYRRANGDSWQQDPFLVCFAEGRMVAAALHKLRVIVVVDDQTIEERQKS